MAIQAPYGGIRLKKNRKIQILLTIGFLALIGLPLAQPVAAYGAADGTNIGIGNDLHDFIIYKAYQILDADGFGSVATEAHTYMEAMMQGSYDADWEDGVLIGTGAPWAARNHYMNPQDHTKLVLIPNVTDSAGKVADRRFENALQAYNEGNYQDAYRYLGYVLHLVSDLTVPHHALKVVLDDNSLDPLHEQYESYCASRQTYVRNMQTTGIYHFRSFYDWETGITHKDDSMASGWVDYAAHISYDLYYLVDGDDGDDDYLAASSYLLKLAVQLCAGVIKFFWDTNNPEDNNPEPIPGPEPPPIPTLNSFQILALNSKE